MDAHGRLYLFAMARAAREDFLDRLPAWASVLCEVFDSGGAERIVPLVIYTISVHRHTDRDTIRKRIAAVVDPEQENAMRPFYEMVVQEGYERAREEPQERLEGQRAMLLRLLGRRFGAVPEQIAARVAAATQQELERWCDRVLDAASLDDVFASE